MSIIGDAPAVLDINCFSRMPIRGGLRFQRDLGAGKRMSSPSFLGECDSVCIVSKKGTNIKLATLHVRSHRLALVNPYEPAIKNLINADPLHSFLTSDKDGTRLNGSL